MLVKDGRLTEDWARSPVSDLDISATATVCATPTSCLASSIERGRPGGASTGVVDMTRRRARLTPGVGAVYRDTETAQSVSKEGALTSPWRRSPDLSNPRAQRTHDHVLSVARAILHEAGPNALTFRTLGERAAVTRQTLYRHWPRRELLLAEIITTGPDFGYPEPGTDARAVLVAFLRTLRAGLDDPPSAASLLAVTAVAGTDATAANTLASIGRERRAALNVLLEPSGTHVDPDAFTRIVGPLIYSILHARHPVSDELIDEIVEGWLTGPHRPFHTRQGDDPRGFA